MTGALLKGWRGLVWLVAVVPSLLGDGADVIGHQGLAQPLPVSVACAPTITLVVSTETVVHRIPDGFPVVSSTEMTSVAVFWSENRKFWIEVTDPWTGSVERARGFGFTHNKVAAEPQQFVQIVSLDGKCRGLSVQVPWEPVASVDEGDASKAGDLTAPQRRMTGPRGPLLEET